MQSRKPDWERNQCVVWSTRGEEDEGREGKEDEGDLGDVGGVDEVVVGVVVLGVAGLQLVQEVHHRLRLQPPLAMPSFGSWSRWALPGS